MEIEGGASGGPVAAMSGHVFGINSTGMNGMAISFISSVEDLLDLFIYNIRLPNGQVFESLKIRDLAEFNLLALQELTKV